MAEGVPFRGKVKGTKKKNRIGKVKKEKKGRWGTNRGKKWGGIFEKVSGGGPKKP